MKIGFIGLGLMGTGMALNLRKAGYELVAFDLRKDSTQALVAAGAAAADSIAELGRNCDVVFSSLPAPKEMREVGEELLQAMRPGTAWFDLTTNSPTVVREVAARFQEAGIAVLDAPVSGGPGGARSGKLALYVGGDRAVFEQHRKLLDAIGDKVMYVGAIGAGTTAKLVHNLLGNVMRMAIAECISLGVKAGLDPVELWHAVRMGAVGRARTLDLVAEQYLQSRYDPPSFALRLAHKDFTLAMDLAREFEVPMPQAEIAYEDFTAAMERGWGNLDSRSPMQLQNERAQVTIQAPEPQVKEMLSRD